jgi:cellulose synthase/poly-beta-1,6-N-acetylglucosamine synthase-like glycosyltransferase
MLLQTLFWLCLFGVVYAYALYPILLFLLARVLGREPVANALHDAELPMVSLLIAAHNEEDVIRDRIVNALALDYRADRLQIVVASDGSTDATADIVRSFGDRVTLLDFKSNRGKAATLNAAMPMLVGEIVILSDANTSIDRASAHNLVRWFKDPSVGAVCGRLKIVDPISGSNVDSAYWKYETFLKRCENRLGALLGSNGAIYAIRRDLFDPIPERTIVDDFVIPLRAVMKNRCRLIYDSHAIGTEVAPLRLQDEFKRRVRIGAGGFQAIGMLWPLLSPRFGWTALTFASHKIVRWTCPLMMLGALACSAWLAASSELYLTLLLMQIAFYAFAAVLMLLPPAIQLPRSLRLVGMFVGMNAALLVGFVRWARGRQNGIWERTQRVAEA